MNLEFSFRKIWLSADHYTIVPRGHRTGKWWELLCLPIQEDLINGQKSIDVDKVDLDVLNRKFFKAWLDCCVKFLKKTSKKY
ncbi:MAG: hypothetical protein ACYDEF_04005 [Methanosarcina sp.]